MFVYCLGDVKGHEHEYDSNPNRGDCHVIQGITYDEHESLNLELTSIKKHLRPKAESRLLPAGYISVQEHAIGIERVGSWVSLLGNSGQ
jgi:phenylalanyl-tRNA synthetase beta subunit